MMAGKLAGILHAHPLLVLFVKHLVRDYSSAAGMNTTFDKVKNMTHPSLWNEGVAGGVRTLRVMILGALKVLHWLSS